MLLHLGGDFETLLVPINRGDGHDLAGLAVADEAVPLPDVAVDLDRVPAFGMADIVDRYVVVLAPEERHGAEGRALAEHVERRGLALPFGDDPVLDADALAGIGVRPARDVAGGIDVGRAGHEALVHADAFVDREARLLGKSEARV